MYDMLTCTTLSRKDLARGWARRYPQGNQLGLGSSR